MKIREGERRAVGGDHKLRLAKPGRGLRDQADLHRPVDELRLEFPWSRLLRTRRAGAGCRIFPKVAGRRTRATAGKRAGCGLLRHAALHGLLVVGIGFAFLEGDRTLRALADAVAQAVAVRLAHQLRLAVDDLNGTLMARLGADAASVALVLVDCDDLPHYFAHSVSPLCKSPSVVFFK